MNMISMHLGSGAGILIQKIALENLIYDYNPEKAMKVITGSLIGIPEDMALKVLIGNLVLLTSDDESTLDAVERREQDKDYPILNVVEWCKEKQDEIGYDGSEIYSKLHRALQSTAKTGNTLSINIPVQSILKFIGGNDKDGILELIANEPRINSTKRVISEAHDFIEKTLKIRNAINWLQSKYIEEFKVCADDEFAPHDVISRIHYLLQNFDSEYDQLVKKNEENKQMLKSHMNAINEIDAVAKAGIKPVDILDNYNAGWLSPEGDYYGLNGEISNQLHIQIADLMTEAGLIPKEQLHEPFDMEADTWLSTNGWVKIHGNWILYDGYSLIKLAKKTIPLTLKQKEQIYKYGQKCHRGMLQLGINKKQVSAARFNMTELPMMSKYFEL